MEIMIYTKYRCYACKALKKWLNTNGFKYIEMPIELAQNKDEFLKRELSGFPSTIIKYNNKEKFFLGNNSKLKKYLESINESTK